jgi:hypothetical protein
MTEYRTRTGRVLTDADIQALADEAERGYDVERLRPRLVDDGSVTVAILDVPRAALRRLAVVAQRVDEETTGSSKPVEAYTLSEAFALVLNNAWAELDVLLIGEERAAGWSASPTGGWPE